MKEILGIVTILVFAAVTLVARPTAQAHEFFKLDRPADVSQPEMVKDTEQELKPLTQAPVQPESKPAEPTPVTPVTCRDDQWVRADNGQCLDKPKQAPTATPHVPVSTAGGGSGSCDLAYNYSWPARTARAICLAESGGNPGATNMGDNHGKCSGSYGLMQVGCFWYPYYGYNSSHYYNGTINMDIAFKIWERQGGFGAWTTYTSGKYYKYL